MNYKKYLTSIIGAFVIIFVGAFVLSLLHYFNIFNSLFVNIFRLLIIFIAMFYSGFVMGKNSSKKGYIEGLKSGLIITFILIIYSFIIMRNSISIKPILYYIILIAISVVGGMIGISKSKLIDSNNN